LLPIITRASQKLNLKLVSKKKLPNWEEQNRESVTDKKFSILKINLPLSEQE